MTSHESLACHARFDRSLINAAGSSVRYLVVTVRAPHLPGSDERTRDPLNLGIVVDTSGSMAGPPLEAAKEAARGVMERLAAEDVLSCVSFATDVHTHFEGIAMDGPGRVRARREIHSMHSHDMTNLCGGWLEGCRCVATVKERMPVGRHRVLLLSDGMANRGITDPATLARHADELRQRGIMTSTVGIGLNYSPIQLQVITEHGGGRMHDAEYPEEIVEIVLAELNDLAATVAEDVRVELKSPAGASVKVLGMFPLELAESGYECSIGAMVAGGHRTIVFQVTTPVAEIGRALPFHVSVKWRRPLSPEWLRTDAVTCELWPATAADCARQPRDRSLALEVARIWQAALVRECMAMNQEGRHLEARDYGAAQLKYFRRYCDGVPGTEALVEELSRMPGFVGMPPEMLPRDNRKEVLLGAYKSLRGEKDRRSRKRDDWADYLKS